jgi:hypothetical protein
MPAQPNPILNTSLPPQFRQIRIELAREPGHPEGDAAVAYVFVAPLNPQDRIDPKLWRAHRDACRLTRSRPDQEERRGHLVHRSGGGWAFRYDTDTRPDDVGFNFTDERFIVGEYVSISEAGQMHTYRVTKVSHL